MSSHEFKLTRRSLLAGMAATSAFAGTSFAQPGGGQLVVANWGGDWNERTVRFFEAPIVEKAGYKILRDLDGFDQRRMKLMSIRRLPRGTIDVAHLDETAANEANEQGVLETIDEKKIPHLADVPAHLKTPYMVPWQYSGWVIGYNPDKIQDPPKSFADLWNPKYKGMIGLTDTHYFHHFEMAALASGQKLDNIDIPRMKAALMDFKKAVAPRIYPQHLQQAQGLKNEEVLLATNYKARVLQFAAEGVKTKPTYPKEGAISMIYGMTLPKKAPNPEGANFYVNALLDPKGMASLAQVSFYSPANSKAELPPEAKAAIEFTADEQKSLHIRPLAFWLKHRAELLEWYNKVFKA